jgi:hypothetical protein
MADSHAILGSNHSFFLVREGVETVASALGLAVSAAEAHL